MYSALKPISQAAARTQSDCHTIFETNFLCKFFKVHFFEAAAQFDEQAAKSLHCITWNYDPRVAERSKHYLFAELQIGRRMREEARGEVHEATSSSPRQCSRQAVSSFNKSAFNLKSLQATTEKSSSVSLSEREREKRIQRLKYLLNTLSS